MDFGDGMQKVYCGISHIFSQIGSLGLQILWHLMHFIVNLCYFSMGIATAIESYLISSGILKRYKTLDIDKLCYLAIAVESEEAYHILKVIELFKWLVDIGIKSVCLYDTEGILKKSKESILGKLNNAALFEEADESNSLLDHKHLTLEFASFSDGKEAVVKAANLLFLKYIKLGDSGEIQAEKFFTEAHMAESCWLQRART